MRPYFEAPGVAIFNGDCLDIAPGISAVAAVTDPPYGIAYQPKKGSKFADRPIANDESVEVRDLFLRAWAPRPALVFGSWKAPYPAGARALLIWDKGTHTGMGCLDLPWKPNHELIFVLGKGFHYTGGNRGTGVLRYAAPPGNSKMRTHPTEKPLDLMAHLVERCPPGLVLDPFMGTGATLMGALTVGRSAVGIEIDERYCEVAARRLRELLEGGG